jgi:hypothetical protein
MAGLSKIIYWVTFTSALLNLIVFTIISLHFGGGIPALPYFMQYRTMDRILSTIMET